MKYKIIILFANFAFFLSGPLYAAELYPTHPNGIGQCADQEYFGKIRNLWLQKKPIYYEWIKGVGSKSDGFSRNHPSELYDIQSETNNLLKYTEYCQDLYVLEELISLYLLALDSLVETEHYVFFYYPHSPRQSVQKLNKKHRMWLTRQEPVGEEVILVSSQFLYVVSEAINIITNIEQAKRTHTMQEFVLKFTPILLNHYKRWIFDKVGPFQVRGWGCKMKGKYVATGLNHFEFITKKLKRKLGDGDSPGFCNSVTDTDMWIIAGVSNLLAAYKKENQLAKIPLEDFERLIIYVKTGVQLLQSRISYSTLKNFDGKTVEGANFDLGAWDDHATYAYAGCSKEKYPALNSFFNIKRRKSGLGWDLSHARRFVHVFEALFKNKKLLHLEFPTEEIMEKLANQLLYSVFNRNFKKPLFSNFMDGSNGWYRVGYRGRIGFGYGPWDMSIAVLTGGYSLWARYNEDIAKLFCAIHKMLESNDPEIRQHVIAHYEQNIWRNYKRPNRGNLLDQENTYTQTVMIQFLPSLCKIDACKTSTTQS
jgi:hypothetical protein